MSRSMPPLQSYKEAESKVPLAKAEVTTQVVDDESVNDEAGSEPAKKKAKAKA